MPLNTVRNWSSGKKLSLVLLSILILPSLVSGIFGSFVNMDPINENNMLLKEKSIFIAEKVIEKNSQRLLFSEVREAIKEFFPDFLNERFYLNTLGNLFAYTGVGLLLSFLVFSNGVKGILFENKTPILFFASVMLAFNIPVVGSDAMQLSELLGLDQLQEMFFNSNYKTDLIQEIEQAFFLFPNENRWYFITWIGIAVIPAVGEEIFFRGLLMKVLTDRFGNIHNAIAVSALLFALFHSSLTNFFYYFVLAVILGYTYYWGRNLLFPILIHLVNNTSVLWRYFEVGAFPELSQSDLVENNGSVSIFSYFTIAIILAVFYFNYKRYHDEQLLQK